MHSCQDIEENRCFSNGGTNLQIHAIVQGRPEDNQVEFLRGPHGIVNPPKNLVLNNIRRFTIEHIGAANGLYGHWTMPMDKTSRFDVIEINSNIGIIDYSIFSDYLSTYLYWL